MKDHLFNMDKHVKNMYKELLDEAGMNKKYDKDINEGIIEIEKLKKELVEKNNFVAFTRRLILVAEYVIPIHPLKLFRRNPSPVSPTLLPPPTTIKIYK